MSPSFVSLPIELREEISALIPPESLQELRLVCKAFRDSITPYMFSRINIHLPTFESEKHRDLPEMLETLTRTSHPAVVCAKSISVSDPPRFRTQITKKKFIYKKIQFSLCCMRVKRLIPLALAKFKNATSITWIINNNSTDWSRESVLSGICQMKHLTELTLDIKVRRKNLSIMKLPALEKLILRMNEHIVDPSIADLINTSPGSIRHIEFHQDDYADHWSSPTSMEPFIPTVVHSHALTHLTLSMFYVPLNSTMIAHCRSLTSLCLTSSAEKRIAEDEKIWANLRCEKIHLKEITLSEPNESFVRYLKSYRGLRKLIISRTQGRNRHQSNQVASEFYTCALVSHIEHMEHLSISSIYDGDWCFGRHSVDTLSLLYKLRYLGMSVGDCSDKITMFDSVPYRLDSRNKNEYPVILLMETVSMLPNLETVFIHDVEPAEGRDIPSYHYTRPKFKVPIVKQIDMQVTTHGPLDPTDYRFIIETESYRYRLRRRSWDGQYWYRIAHTYPSKS